MSPPSGSQQTLLTFPPARVDAQQQVRRPFSLGAVAVRPNNVCAPVIVLSSVSTFFESDTRRVVWTQYVPAGVVDAVCARAAQGAHPDKQVENIHGVRTCDDCCAHFARAFAVCCTDRKFRRTRDAEGIHCSTALPARLASCGCALHTPICACVSFVCMPVLFSCGVAGTYTLFGTGIVCGGQCHGGRPWRPELCFCVGATEPAQQCRASRAQA